MPRRSKMEPAAPIDFEEKRNWVLMMKMKLSIIC